MEEAVILEAARSHPLLNVLDSDVLRSVVRASKVVTYRPKRTFLHEGEPPKQVFCLLNGAVRVFHRADAQDESEVLLKLFRAPALFGEMEVMADRPFMEYVTTIEVSDVLHVPATVFRHLIRTQTAFSQTLAFDLAARLCIAAHNLKALAFCDVDTRLANLLLDYAQFFGEPDGQEGTRLTVALTQDGMAKDLAVTRKALSGALKKLRDRGVLLKADARYVIKDLDALRTQGSATVSLSYRSNEPTPHDR